MLYIVQVMAKKKIVHTTNNGSVYTSEKLKIHPVEADTEILAIEKVHNHYKGKSGWVIRIVDSEELIK